MYNLISFRGYFDFDFGNENIELLFNYVKIKRLFVCYQPVFKTYMSNESFSRKILNRFYQDLKKFAIEYKTKCVMFIGPPFVKDAYNMIIDSKYFKIVFIPYIIDPSYITFNNIVDQELLKNRKEIEGKCQVPSFYDFDINFVESKEIVIQAIKYFKRNANKVIFMQVDGKKARLSEYLKGICAIEPGEINYEITNKLTSEFKGKINIKSQLLKIDLNHLMKNLNIIKKTNKLPYVTIILTGRNDDYNGNFKERISNMFQSIAFGIKKYPGSNIKIMFVSYRNPVGKPHLPYILNIPEILKNKLEITIITDNDHDRFVDLLGNYRNLSFLEFIGKNVASRRTKAKFFLFTNGDNILPEFLFEVFSLRQLNPTFFYKTDRLNDDDLLINDNISMFEKSSYPWKYSATNYSFKNYFFHQRMYFHLVEEKYMEISGLGDFTLISKEMFDLLNGYDQHPTNWGTDHLLDTKMQRFAPNHISFRLNIPIFHQGHFTNHSQTQSWFHYVIMKEIKCKGFCIRKNFSFYNAIEYFGFPYLDIKVKPY